MCPPALRESQWPLVQLWWDAFRIRVRRVRPKLSSILYRYPGIYTLPKDTP